LGTLILLDEVLMYAREKAAEGGGARHRLINFFQYLTQAATKTDRCCIVASLLASNPEKNDGFGRELQGELYDIFQRQREEAVEPVVKEDVAEVLRRRFFTPESLHDRERFRQHVIAALKGIRDLDAQTASHGGAAEERFLRSYPFHPDLTEVFYSKWTQLNRFQRTRGVLRTFALALREAEQWDLAPLIGPAVFLGRPGQEGLSEAMRELVTVADTETHEGRRQAWTGVLDGELGRAREIEVESVGLKLREVEQAVVVTFLHSQPVGQSAKIRDLLLLLGATRPDKIELEKGLRRWAESSYWLDDRHTAAAGGALPAEWRLGNRPNLTQMHAKAAAEISDDLVKARLMDEIGRTRALTRGASGAGVRVHTLPTQPRDVEDDGDFHFAVLGPSAACDSGKPSVEARRFLDETTGPDRPRVYRNALLLVAPSKDGLELASRRIRDYLAWEQVRSDVTAQQNEGTVDPIRVQTLAMNLDKAKARIPEAIQQAYSTVVTVSEKNEVQAFKITVTEEPLFATIKEDPRSRVQETAVTAEALLPGGPYDLWREGEESRRVKDLAGAFAQLPHLPKMLKAEAIRQTLVEGCAAGSFVLRLTRPDHSFRTWWCTRPDEAALADPALELVLPGAAELAAVVPEMLAPGVLPGLWSGEAITVGEVVAYFSGGTVVQVEREGYEEPLQIPKAAPQVVEKGITEAVASGQLWLLSGPASILAEFVPAGVMTAVATLRPPPVVAPPAGLLPENLAEAWQAGETTALSIATALSQRAGITLPWTTVREAIGAALRSRFLELSEGSAAWPCELPSASSVKLKVATPGSVGPGGGVAEGRGGTHRPNVLAAEAEFEPAEIQDLGDAIPDLLKIRAKSEVPIRFRVRIELGDGGEMPPPEVVDEINQILDDFKDDYRLR